MPKQYGEELNAVDRIPKKKLPACRQRKGGSEVAAILSIVGILPGPSRDCEGISRGRAPGFSGCTLSEVANLTPALWSAAWG